jgi:outer membrane protein OmpA-like peptidoglycan-associated protein
MTLKRYQPVRRRKRPSKKNRPLKMVLAVGVVGVAAGLAYFSLHGEMLVGLLDGSVDLPDSRFRATAAPSANAAPAAKPAPVATPMARLRTHVAVVASPAAPVAPSIAPSVTPASVAPLRAAVVAQPSAFPEHGHKAPSPAVVADATVLKPAGVASVAPKPSPKPTAAPAKPVVVAKPASAKPSPAAVAKATPSPKAVVAVKPSPKADRPVMAAHPSSAPKVAARPTAKPATAPRAVAAAAGRGGSLYFDQNSSYLSSAEKDRLAGLVDAIAKRGGTIHVAGYADAVGDVSYSRWIASRRASRVADLIRARAAGKVNVVVDAVDVVPGADGEAKNRRVEIQVK